MSLGTLLPRHATYRPHHLAVVYGETRLDYAAFDQRVARVAGALASLGLVAGDKVATVMSNRLELLEVYWAAARLGLVVVPMSPLVRGEGLRTLLVDSDADAVVTEPEYAGFVDAIRAQLALPHCLLVDFDGRAGYLDYAALCMQAAPAAVPAIDDDAAYNIIYSSGTTGLPKGIVLSHRARLGYCTAFAAAFRMTPESVVLHAGSIVFNGAFLTLMPSMYLGATYILEHQFDAAAFIATVRRERVTHVMLVPSQIVALLAHPEFGADALGSLEMICSVGAPLHLAHKEALNAALPGRFYELYGLTEGFMTVLDKHDAPRKLASVGAPLPDFEMRIERPDGSVAAPGELGEIVGKSPLLMQGYYKRPDLTEAAIVDGWLRTGDLGIMDADGFLQLVDRKKDLIISGGVNVYPRDIEEVIVQHPAIREAAVFGVPHARWGEAPVAAVVLRTPDVDRDAIKQWVNERVGARYQRLDDVVVMADLPRGTTGKILKRVIRDGYVTNTTTGAFVEGASGAIHYLRSGTGKTPLIVLHGLTCNAHFFGGLMTAGLGDRYDVVRIDLRGRGQSAKPATGYTLADHAGDVLAVMDALGLPDAVVCGHSYGALVTMWLAAHHPTRVRRQILLDIASSSIKNDAVLGLIKPALDRLDRPVASLAHHLAQARALPSLEGRWPDELAAYYRADVDVFPDGTVRPRSPRAVIDQVIQCAQLEDWPAIVAAAKPPALVVHAGGAFGAPGTSPLVLRTQAEDLAAKLPDARLVPVPGNHYTMMFEENAVAVVAAIDGFLAAPKRAPLSRDAQIETRP